MPTLFQRISRTNWIHYFDRANTDASIPPKMANDIQLVEVVRDLSHIPAPVPNPSVAHRGAEGAGGAGVFSGFQLAAPATATIAVALIINKQGAPVNFLTLAIDDPSAFTATAAPTTLQWGGASQARYENGTFAAAATVGNFLLLDGEEFDAIPLVLQPGDILSGIFTLANTVAAWEIWWTEVQTD